MSLPLNEFLDRLLLHIPQPGTQVVRGYGLYSRTDKEALRRCREQLGPGREAVMLARRPCSRPVRSPLDTLRFCPVCARPRVRGEDLPRSGAPPPALSEERPKSAA